MRIFTEKDTYYVQQSDNIYDCYNTLRAAQFHSSTSSHTHPVSFAVSTMSERDGKYLLQLSIKACSQCCNACIAREYPEFLLKEGPPEEPEETPPLIKNVQ